MPEKHYGLPSRPTSGIAGKDSSDQLKMTPGDCPAG